MSETILTGAFNAKQECLAKSMHWRLTIVAGLLCPSDLKLALNLSRLEGMQRDVDAEVDVRGRIA
jgi:hypothetical protein